VSKNSYRKTHINTVMVVRQTGQVPPSAVSLFAQLSQKHSCLCGTNVNPSHSATGQASQHSVSMPAAFGTAVVTAAEVDSGVAVISCVASLLLLSLS